MAKKSSRLVRKSAAELPRASKADLERLQAAMQRPANTREIAERRRFNRLQRDSAGKLPVRTCMIRDAVEKEIKTQRLSVYRVWQLARVHCPSLSQSAIHEFLKGKRQIELPSIEALLAAMQLQIVRRDKAKRA